MKCTGKRDTTWTIPRSITVFPTTFHVKSRKVDYLQTFDRVRFWPEQSDRREGKFLRCCLGGHNFFQFLAELAFLHQDDWKKWMNRATANERMIYTIPNRHLAKMVVLPKTFVYNHPCCLNG